MDNYLYPNLTSQVAATIADDRAVIVLADLGQVTVLNELGTFIWKLCNGKHNIEQIVHKVVDEYEVEFSIAEKDVTEFLRDMVELRAILLQ